MAGPRKRAAWEPWLDCRGDAPAALARRLEPFPAEEMLSRAVGPRVHQAGNDGPACIEPLARS